MSATVQFPSRTPPRESGEFGAALAEGFARRVGALAGRLGASPVAVRWARRAAFAVSRATSAGHVCVALDRLAQRYGEPPDRAAAVLLQSGVVSNGAQEASTLRPLVLDAAGRLYLARYYEDERRLAQALVAHAATLGVTDARGEPASSDAGSAQEGGDRTDEALAARLTRFFGPSDAREVDWQRACAALSLSSRLTVVSGGPGTGKTTTVAGMLACLIDANPSLTIALAAPTGKAAQRMQEALLARAASLPADIAERLPRTSQTLHRLLGLGRDARARYGRDNPLPYDLIVIDEASMIDLTLAAQLFDALAPQTRLVLLGDKDQLAAVEAGAVFAELSARPTFSASGIGRIAQATGVDEARVRAALPRPDKAPEQALGAGGFDAGTATDEDGLDLFEPLDSVGPLESLESLESLDDAWAWTGLDEPEAAYVNGDLPNARPEQPAPAAERLAASGPVSDRPSAANPVPDSAPLADCVVWLERNYRFGLDSPIGRLSTAIRRGDVEAALDALGAGTTRADPAQTDLFPAHAPAGPDLNAPAVLDEDSGTALSAQTVERLARGFEPYVQALNAVLADREADCAALFDALNTFRILCATRVGARGVQTLNAQIAEHVRRAARAPLAVGTHWFAGRAVMVARNDYALGLFNGDIGIALPTREGPLRVYFRTAVGGVRAVAPAALPPHDTAFALTVHKSQGSEFDHAALVLPATTHRVLTRELVYTAVTRARKTVRVIGAREVLAGAIASPTRRDSGLLARMQESSR
jgi:exodeoxyribonuclease V alpha subunit